MLDIALVVAYLTCRRAVISETCNTCDAVMVALARIKATLEGFVIFMMAIQANTF